MLNHGKLAGTGKFVILPGGSGASSTGRREASRSIRPLTIRVYHFQLAIDAGCNAIRSAARISRSRSQPNTPGEIPLILKLNNHDVLKRPKKIPRPRLPPRRPRWAPALDAPRVGT